jgi:hypothetical protein
MADALARLRLRLPGAETAIARLRVHALIPAKFLKFHLTHRAFDP